MPINEQIEREKYVLAAHMNRQSLRPRVRQFTGLAETILQTATDYLPPVDEPAKTGTTTNASIAKAVAGVQDIIGMDPAYDEYQRTLKTFGAPMIDTYDPEKTIPWYRENHENWVTWSEEMDKQRRRYEAELALRTEADEARNRIVDNERRNRNNNSLYGRAPY